MRKTVLIAGMMVTLLTAQASADDVIAKIGEKKITDQEFTKFVNSFPPDRKKFLDENLVSRKTIFERMVQVEVVSEIARKQGLDKEPKVRAQLDNILKEYLAQELLKRVGDVEPTEEDIRQYYKAHPEEFKTPEMVRARHILLKIPKTSSSAETIIERAKMKDKIESLLARLKAGEDFAKLAAENSDDAASKPKGGDLGFFPKGKMAAQFEAKAFSMKIGEMSDVVETNYGFHIIRVEGRKEAGAEPLEAIKDKAKEKVKSFVKKSKTSEFMNQAYKDAGVEFYMDNMKLPPKDEKK